MQRRTSSQDVSWLIDLHNKGQLDMDPPYQRRSVWNLKDRQYFLDTIFGDYSSPPIYLHKLDAEEYRYAVVDGKQRLETIFLFVNNEVPLASSMQRENLRGKRWNQLERLEKQLL